MAKFTKAMKAAYFSDLGRKGGHSRSEKKLAHLRALAESRRKKSLAAAQ